MLKLPAVQGVLGLPQLKEGWEVAVAQVGGHWAAAGSCLGFFDTTLAVWCVVRLLHAMPSCACAWVPLCMLKLFAHCLNARTAHSCSAKKCWPLLVHKQVACVSTLTHISPLDLPHSREQFEIQAGLCAAS